jgi:hypothetical protein
VPAEQSTEISDEASTFDVVPVVIASKVKSVADMEQVALT